MDFRHRKSDGRERNQEQARTCNWKYALQGGDGRRFRTFAGLKEQTDGVLRTLTQREEEVLRMRFGVGDGAEHTLEEVGRYFNVTRERIRQIESKALRKLRHPTRATRLRPFLDSTSTN